MKLKSLPILLAAILSLASNVQADNLEYCLDADTSILDGQNVFTHEFQLGAIQSIDYVTIELTHAAADDIDFTLTNIPFGSTWVFSTDNGGFSNLAGVYTFVSVFDPDNGGNGRWDPSLGDDGTNASGFYDAETWVSRSIGWDASLSDWRLVLSDDADNGQVGQVGKVTVGYTTAVPEPSAIAVLGLMAVGLFVRRRKAI